MDVDRPVLWSYESYSLLYDIVTCVRGHCCWVNVDVIRGVSTGLGECRPSSTLFRCTEHIKKFQDIRSSSKSAFRFSPRMIRWGAARIRGIVGRDKSSADPPMVSTQCRFTQGVSSSTAWYGERWRAHMGKPLIDIMGADPHGVNLRLLSV